MSNAPKKRRGIGDFWDTVAPPAEELQPAPGRRHHPRRKPFAKQLPPWPSRSGQDQRGLIPHDAGKGRAAAGHRRESARSG